MSLKRSSGARSRSQARLPTARDVMLPAELVLSVNPDERVETIIERSLPGQIIVVEYGGLPRGISREPAVRAFPDVKARVGEYLERFQIPAITFPDTPVVSILKGMEAYPEIRWLAVQEGNQLQGVITPDIYVYPHAATRGLSPNLILNPPLLRALGVFNQLAGVSRLPENSSCYCCQNQADQHCYSVKIVQGMETYPVQVKCPRDSTDLVLYLQCPKEIRET